MVIFGPFKRHLIAAQFPSQMLILVHTFRSDAALEIIRKASEERTSNLVLYNYPSFSGAYGALFAQLYHSRLNLPCLILPFSAVVPFSVKDLCIEGMKTCYFLDSLGPKGFALELAQKTSCKFIGFDHRKSVLSHMEDSDMNLTFHLNTEKGSSTAAYEYFSTKLSKEDGCISLLNHEDQERLERILEYMEGVDLRRWSLPDIKPFIIGIKEWRSKLNCITNPSMYQQLIGLCLEDLIAVGNTYISRRQTEANNLLSKVFRLRLGRGFYGECLGIRADDNSEFSDEMGQELSRRSAQAGLRPIGAVIYPKRKNLKMCLRSTDSGTDTSQIAKAYGGGGSPRSSSFIIRMDEYNQWRSENS